MIAVSEATAFRDLGNRRELRIGESADFGPRNGEPFRFGVGSVDGGLGPMNEREIVGGVVCCRRLDGISDVRRVARFAGLAASTVSRI